MQLKPVPAELILLRDPLVLKISFETQQGIQEESLRLRFSMELVNDSTEWELKAKPNRLNTVLQVWRDELDEDTG